MSNALVPLAPTDRDSGRLRASRRPNADFIAHLIATAAQAPQTRARRRAEPEAGDRSLSRARPMADCAGRAQCRASL